MGEEANFYWIHFTGIAGVTLAQLAVALAEKGNFVTGSDEAMYEPMKSYLARHPEIELHNEFSYRNLILNNYQNQTAAEERYPDLIVAQGGLPSSNKELLFAKKHNLKIEHYPQVLEEELVIKENSIVVAGSFGKTTTTALLVEIFNAARLEISFMVGGILANHAQSLKLKAPTTQYSITEGDEYLSSRTDPQSKFFYYHPKYLVLTGYQYDHTDLFETEKDYFENYEKLIKQLPVEGLLVYNERYPELEKLAQTAHCQTIKYSSAILPRNIETKLFGDFNLENIAAAWTLAIYLGIKPEVCETVVANFSGLKRRLEIIKQVKANNGAEVLIIDDFGATPAKAEAAVAAVRSKYAQAKLICLYEPNVGNRTSQALANFTERYSEIFKGVDLVVFPQFDELNQTDIFSAVDFDKAAKQKNITIPSLLITDNLKLAEELSPNFAQDRLNILLFLSSHSIDELLRQF